MATNLGVQQLFDAIDRLSSPAQTSNAGGFQATKVPGHPLYMTWGFYLGNEVTANQTVKLFLFLPYLPVGSQPIRKISGASAIESPIEMVMSAVNSPYNLKATFPSNLDIRKLTEREFYFFLLAMQPAAVSNKGEKANPYSDAHVKAFSVTPNESFKDIFSLFKSTKTDWENMKVSQQTEHIENDIANGV